MTGDQRVLADLTTIFRGIFDDPALDIIPETTAGDVAGWDSARMVEIIIEAEAFFECSFSSKEVDGLKNVGDFVHLISRKRDHSSKR